MLSVEIDGVVAERSFSVGVTSEVGYARVGDLARAQSDAHGCPACPHTTVGPVTSGSPTFFWVTSQLRVSEIEGSKPPAVVRTFTRSPEVTRGFDRRSAGRGFG